MENETALFIKRMAEDLTTLGVECGDTIFVHSSLRSLGYLPGGAESAVQAFILALGADGTLLMPGFSYSTVTRDNPVFDVNNTPVCVGALPEYFRTRRGTLRSINPTHSVLGIGAKASALLADHELDDTPCGEHSPLRKLRDTGGKILFLGCGLKPNTSMHAVEELIRPEYLFAEKVAYRIILNDDHECCIGNYRHKFSGWSQEYQRAAQLLSPQALQHGKVLAADAYLMDACTLWTKALDALRQDPFAFVARRV